MNIKYILDSICEWEDCLIVDGRICDSVLDDYPELQRFKDVVKFTKTGCYQKNGITKSKICFPDRETAKDFKAVWNKLAEKNPELRPQKDIYWCDMCKGYHTSTHHLNKDDSMQNARFRQYFADLQERYAKYM